MGCSSVHRYRIEFIMSSSTKKPPGLFQFLLPLILCVLFVLGLIGYRQQKVWSERTRVKFTVTLAGKNAAYGASVLLDGHPVGSGDKISLGSHTFTVKHPKAESFQTKFFAWFGGRDLGQIDLKRIMGSLAVTATPAAQTLTITGPEFSLTLHDTVGTNLSVPTDNYRIRAEYAHWTDTRDYPVTSDSSTSCNFNPHLGAISLTCNQSDATYQVRDDHASLVETGNLPALLAGLPAGNFQVVATRHRTSLTNSILVVAATTNSLPIEFQYGALVLETSPTGATVADEAGQLLGQTPVNLAEILPGNRVFTLQKNGYPAIQINLVIEANRTTTIRTNLISKEYLDAMDMARRQMASTNYDRALTAVQRALDASPNDTDALALQQEGRGRQAVQTAKIAGARNDFSAGIKALKMALDALPDNEEAKAMLVEFTKQDAAQREQAQQARQAVPQMALAAVENRDTFRNEESLFEVHELTTSKPFADLESALILAFTTKSPTLTARSKKMSWPESFGISCKQELSGGLRKVFIAGAKINDNETRILFKVLEYTAKHDVSLSGGLTFNTSFAPLHEPEIGELTPKMKAQIEDGLRMVTERIQEVTGQP